MKTVFVDVDTQLDFMFPAGALYVPGAERLLPAFDRLTRYAAGHAIPVVSTTDAHQENDPEFRDWPPHCVAGTAGQQKAAATLLDGRVVAPMGGAVPALEGAPQIIVQKRHIDVFAESSLAEVVARLGAGRFVVYGLVTEYCVRTAALGLLRLGGQVEVVREAIGSLSESEAERTFAALRAGGGRLIGLGEALG